MSSTHNIPQTPIVKVKGVPAKLSDLKTLIGKIYQAKDDVNYITQTKDILVEYFKHSTVAIDPNIINDTSVQELV
jgi:hypothetical protein